MKTTSNSKNLRSLSLLLFAFMLCAVSFSSCTKGTSNDSLSAHVQVTNSSEGSVPQDFYLDNSKVTGSAVAYAQSSGYVTTGTGDHQAQFKNSGTATVNTSFSLSLAAGQYYSVFYTDGSSNTTVQDDRTAPQSGKARIRFINLSSAVSSNVDFAANGGIKLVSNLAYKAASTYYDVDPSTVFTLYASGSATVLLSIPSSLQAGHIYTIYVSGATAATVTSHTIMEN